MVGIPNHRRGPSRNQLLCLKLNFAAVKAPYLAPTQLDAMELQFKIAVKDTYEVIHGSARSAAALAPLPQPRLPRCLRFTLLAQWRLSWEPWTQRW